MSRGFWDSMRVLLWHQVWSASDHSRLLSPDWLSACSAIVYRNILAGPRFVFISQRIWGRSGAWGQGERASSVYLARSLSLQSKQQEEVVNHGNVLSRNSEQQGEWHAHTRFIRTVHSSQKRRFNQWKWTNGTRSPIAANHKPVLKQVQSETFKYYVEEVYSTIVQKKISLISFFSQQHCIICPGSLHLLQLIKLVPAPFDCPCLSKLSFRILKQFL